MGCVLVHFKVGEFDIFVTTPSDNTRCDKKEECLNSSHKNTKLGEGWGWVRKMADEIL